MNVEKQVQLKIIESADGSHTLYHEGLQETYHSTHGARQESDHVFIKEGIDVLIDKGLKSIIIFEVGFGTGLNAWLTYKRAKEKSIEVIYHSIEPFPLEYDLISKLNYTANEKDENFVKAFDEIHKTPWGESIRFDANFTLHKFKARFEDIPVLENHYDIIYFDAFAPNKQPEVWSPENIAKTHYMLRKGGRLVTYCAKGQFKRDLKAVGYEVETLVGPPGKKEMTRALKL